MFAILKHWHPEIGRDLHQPWPPGSPVISPAPAPYITFTLLFGNTLGFTTQFYFKEHPSSGLGLTMAKGTDAGPLIPHFGVPSILMPIEFVFSSSKSHFGASRYQGFDNKRAQNCVAVALAIFVNPNLNCGTPWALPLGAAIALNTHCAMMTLGDFVGGLLSMGFDILLSRVMSAIGSVGGSMAGSIAARLGFRYVASQSAAKAIIRAMGRAEARAALGAATREFGALARMFLERSRPGYRLIEPLGSAFAGIFLGSPTGIDLGTFKGPTLFGAVTDYVSPTPEGDPSAPPPPPTYGALLGPSDTGGAPGGGPPPDAGVPPSAGPPPDASSGSSGGTDGGSGSPPSGPPDGGTGGSGGAAGSGGGS